MQIGDPGAATWKAAVAASVGSITSLPASAQLVGVTTAANWPGDRVVASYTAGMLPSAVIASAPTTPAPCDDQVVSFVRVALLPDKSAPCSAAGARGRVAVFSQDHALTLKNVKWKSTSSDVVNVSGNQGSPVAVPVKVWIAIPEQLSGADLDSLRRSVSDFAVTDVAGASAILARNRAGITFTLPVDVPTQILTDATEIQRVGGGCTAADGLAANSGTGPFSKDTLNVYYVQSVERSARGFTCYESPTRRNYVVYVGWSLQSPATLIHELGHALGLRFPSGGHTDAIPGFDMMNIMSTILNDKNANARDHLSLGQAFRMSVDNASWANLATGSAGARVRPLRANRLACQCQTDARTPCPRLAEDVVTVLAAAPLLDPSACSDVVSLTETWTAQGHTGIGLVNGRFWRDTTHCARDVVGAPYELYGHLAFMFPNLTWPGSKCSSWVAVFFDHNAALYETIPGDAGAPWDSDLIDYGVDAVPTASVEVPVNVWYDGGDPVLESFAKEDTAEANAIYNTDTGRPTGIHLNPLHQPGSPTLDVVKCAADAFKRGQINVYYSTATSLTGDGKLCQNAATGPQTDYIFIRRSSHTSHALAHLLGRALGLPEETRAPFDASNVMWKKPVSDPTLRRTLTLGQIFWINLHESSWLNRSVPSRTHFNCAAEPNSCARRTTRATQ